MLGETFGSYEITGHLGKGGMGDVYRARDTRLDRDVAIKVLPPEFAGDAPRLARFEREAKVLASLNHANIASIYGLEWHRDRQHLVLELVEGENLAQRLERGPLPVDEALPVALQIAEGLEAAHERGVIHRDLKPSNVMVDGAGHVKLLDFGLAKVREGQSEAAVDPSLSPTLTMQATQAGMILGTAPYMSPEQARGKVVDTRTDIWAFGCVLFEMLTASRAFTGSDVTEILSAIIQREPDLQRLPTDTPRPIYRLIKRCLRKAPRSRLRDIGDARNELEATIRDPDEEAAAEAVPRRRNMRILPWAIAVILAIALAAALRLPGSSSVELPVRRFTIDVPWHTAPNWTDFQLALSPNGNHVAYNCRQGNDVSICVRSLDSLTARRLADARDLDEMFFSPDGTWIGFSDGKTLAKVSIHGGQKQTICSIIDPKSSTSGDMLSIFRGASWGVDGNILVGSDAGLFRVPATGGNLEPIIRVEEGKSVRGYYAPAHLPGGERALVTVLHEEEPSKAAVVDLVNGTVQDLPLTGRNFVYSATGHIVFRQGDTVLAATFDPDDPRGIGEPIPVMEDVHRGPRLASDGTLAYIPTRGDSSAKLVWVDRTGRPTPIAGERRDYSHLDLASDGRRALLNVSPGVYVLDLERGTRNLLSKGGFPIWTSDGRRATYLGRRGVMAQPGDGSGAAQVLIEGDDWVVPTSWNPVTGDLAYYSHSVFDIWILPQEGDPFAFLGGPGRKRSGRFSPDGKWLAYVNDETGEYQVYVTAYPGPGPNVAVSVDSGLSPIWSPDGRELFFRRGGKVLSAAVSYEDGIRFDTPVELFDGPYTLDLMGHQRYDVSPDGQSFLMVENSDDFPIVIVQNWGLELSRR